MSHHGREYEDDIRCDSICTANFCKLQSAVVLITAISKGEAHYPADACDTWLERNGFECEVSRRRQRERRATELDAEIERLRAERAKL